MADKASKTSETNPTSKMKRKRLPKSQRAHVRRLKQEARKTGATHI